MRFQLFGYLATCLVTLIMLSCGGTGEDFASEGQDTTKYYSPVQLEPEAGESEEFKNEIKEPAYPDEMEAPVEIVEESRAPEAVISPDDIIGSGAGGGGTSQQERGEAAIKKAAASYDSANVAFNAPDSMQLGDTMRIMLLLSKKLSVPELSAHITEPGEIRSDRIRTSGLMEANLKGRGFQIEPITKSIQKIDLEQEKIEWSWQITALEAGTRRLYLTIDLHTPGSTDFVTTTINTLEEEILIYVTWQKRIAGFVSANWQWLWTTILVPFVGWIYNARKRKKEKAD